MSPIAGSEPRPALIIGCGAIAGGYDEADRDSPRVLTHAKAYLLHPGFRIAACVEPDPERRAHFMARWGVPSGFASLDEVDVNYEVASLCVPTALHAGLLERLLASPARLVWAEKPLTDNLARSRAVVEAFAHVGKPIAVNYLRRWATGIRALRDEIAEGGWGRLQAVSAWYTKGLLNNGSHVLDLLAFLFGPLVARASAGRLPDGRDDDRTLDAVLATPDGARIHLVGADARAFALFEIDMMFTQGRVQLTESGFVIVRRRVVDSPRFPGYRILGEAETTDSGLDRAMLAALDDIEAQLDNGSPLASDGRSALAAQELCARLDTMEDES